MEQVSLGIIGAGHIVDAHLDAMARLPALKVTAVCDTDPQARGRVSAALGVRAYATYAQMLEDPPDVVLVALPHGLHCQVSVAALQAGCHVLVEKPMAVSVDQCRQMLAAARTQRRLLLVAESAGVLPGPVRTGEHFASGSLGRFFTGGIVNARHYFHPGRPAWFLDPTASGGGMFTNVGLHRLAVSRACLPELTPITVSASVAHRPEWDVEACTTALVRYAQGGAVMYEEVGYYPRPPWLQAGTHYVFAEGIVSWDAEHWRLADRKGVVHEEELPPATGYVRLYETLLETMRCGESSSQSQGYAVDTAIAHAMYASARRQAEVDLRAPEWRID